MNTDKKSINIQRNLAVILYDLIIIIAILLLATSLLLFVYLLLGTNTPNPHSIFFRLYLASIIIGYYHICWRYFPNGQTLGMKAWNVKLINNKVQRIAIHQSLKRMFGGIIGFVFLGLGYFIRLFKFNKNNLSLADYVSSTQLVMNF